MQNHMFNSSFTPLKAYVRNCDVVLLHLTTSRVFHTTSTDARSSDDKISPTAFRCYQWFRCSNTTLQLQPHYQTFCYSVIMFIKDASVHLQGYFNFRI